MEKLIYTKKLEEQLKTQTWTVENGVFVKRNKYTSNIETINIIDKNLDKLKKEYYAIVCYFYESTIDGKIKPMVVHIMVTIKTFKTYTKILTLIKDKF